MQRLRWCVSLVALALVACGASSPETSSTSPIPAQLSGPVTIEYWYPYSSTVGKAVTTAVNNFNQQQAGKIKVNAVFQGTFDQQLAKIRAAAAGGGLPQVATVRESDITQFDKSGLVSQLDPYVKDAKQGLNSQQLSDIYPGVLGRTKLGVWNNRTLAWPMGNTAAAWFYNIDLMNRSGIQNPPATWDELVAAGKTIKATTGQPAWNFRADQAGPWFINALWTYGVPWLSADGTTTNFDNRAALEVLRMFRQMVDDGTIAVSSTADNDFMSGRGAMLLASSGNIVKFSQQITAFKWGVTILPHQASVKPITEMFGSVNTMFKGTADQQLAAWIFMKYMASSDTQSQFSADAGYFPSTKSSDKSTALQTAYAQIPQLKAAVQSIAPFMQLLPQSTALDQVRNRIATDDVTLVLLKKLSPEDGQKKLKLEADQAIKQASA
jgi:ABC-type glycerol-3-phosphate transport system substrate-binding protein